MQDQRASDSEVNELIAKGRADGAKLYSVVDALHKLVMFLIAVVAIIGLIAGFGLMSNVGFAAGLAVLVFVLILCFLLYAADIVITNSSKVLFHILFSNLVLVEGAKK
jgi:hypothetical protein